MKKLLLALVLGVFMVNLSFAQSSQTPEQRAEKRTESLVKLCKVDKKDEAKVYKIFLEESKLSTKQRNALPEKETSTFKLKSVLSPEQYKKYTDKLASDKAKRDARKAEEKKKTKK